MDTCYQSDLLQYLYHFLGDGCQSWIRHNRLAELEGFEPCSA